MPKILRDFEVVELIKEKIQNKTPFLLSRYGDGEMAFIKQNWKAASNFAKRWFGYDISLEEKQEIRNNLIETIKTSDVLGLYLNNIPKKNKMNLWYNMIQYFIANGFIDKKTQLICDIDIHHNLFRSGKNKGIELEIFSGLESLYYISSRSMDEKMKTHFDIDDVHSYQTVPQFRCDPCKHPKITNKYFKEVVSDGIKWINKRKYDGSVCLYGAGAPGKIFGKHFKQNGGIAIDIGSVFDYWYGRNVRGNQSGPFVKCDDFEIAVERPTTTLIPIYDKLTPRIYNFIVYAPKEIDKNIGAMYNKYMEMLPNDSDWACFLDHDAMFTTPDWYHHICEIVKKYGDKYDLFIAKTNRVGNPAQVFQEMSEEHDILKNREFGKKIQDSYYCRVTKYTGTRMSGVGFILSKRAWLAGCKFKSGFFDVDNDINRKVQRFSACAIMEGVYIYHVYRADGNPHVIGKEKTKPKIIYPTPMCILYKNLNSEKFSEFLLNKILGKYNPKSCKIKIKRTGTNDHIIEKMIENSPHGLVSEWKEDNKEFDFYLVFDTDLFILPSDLKNLKKRTTSFACIQNIGCVSIKTKEMAPDTFCKLIPKKLFPVIASRRIFGVIDGVNALLYDV